MSQEDVRTWVAKIMIDALKQGASQGMLLEPEETAPGGVAPLSVALTGLISAMLMLADNQPRVTRTYVFRDSNEQMFRILKVSTPHRGAPGQARSCQCVKIWLYISHFTEPRIMRGKGRGISLIKA